MQLSPEMIQLIRDVGVSAFIVILLAIVLFMFVMMMRDRSKAENTGDITLAKIAAESSVTYKEIGTIRQELGMAQGQVIILLDNVKTAETKRIADNAVFQDKIYVLQDTVSKQAEKIARHEGRILELESETKRKDEIIKSKESTILELTTANTKLQVVVEEQKGEIGELTKQLQLVTRVQSLEDTLILTEEERLEATKELPNIELTEVPDKPTNEPLPKAS